MSGITGAGGAVRDDLFAEPARTDVDRMGSAQTLCRLHASGLGERKPLIKKEVLKCGASTSAMMLRKTGIDHAILPAIQP